MKPLSGLFRPTPFLVRYPVLHRICFQEEMYTLELRPFSIMEDIPTTYSWINKPHLLGSGHIKTYQRNILKYYKAILDSSDSQAFMILQEGRAVCQIDLFWAAADPLHSRFAINAHDVSIRYLAEFRIPAALFSNSVYLCLDYLFSFSDNPTTFTSMESSGLITGEVFTRIGFEHINGFLRDEKPVKVYACNRDGLKRIRRQVTDR